MHPPINRILIMRLSSIGDIILTTPLVRALRTHYPEAVIDYFVKSQFAPLIEHNPHIDHLYRFDSKEGMSGLKRWKDFFQQQSYDWFVDIHVNLRSRYLRMGLRGARTTTYSKQQLKRTILIKTGIDLYGRPEPVYRRYFEAIEPMGLTYNGEKTEVFVPDDTQKAVDDLLLRWQLQNKEELHNRTPQEADQAREAMAVLVPSASWKNKQWKPEGFARLADSLQSKHGMMPVLLGGPGDEELTRQVGEQMQTPFLLDLAGRLNLLESAALLGRARVVVSNDSGMLHLAQARGAPVVAIFGPTTRQLGYFPFPEKSSVVERMDVSCRPCTHNGLHHCPRGHHRCMEWISAEDVESAVLSVLEKGPNA